MPSEYQCANCEDYECPGPVNKDPECENDYCTCGDCPIGHWFQRF